MTDEAMRPRHHARDVLQRRREGMGWDEALAAVPEDWKELVREHIRTWAARKRIRKAG